MSKPFQFKEFAVEQDKSAMKIGTDGVLLGAWVSLSHLPNNILDIGAGTGIIALQMAQRSLAESVDAVEINTDAYEQCVGNFENSPWNDRLFCYHASIQEFASEIDESYDLIISNPPFYSENYKTNTHSRDVARFTETLPFEHLITSAAHLLSENGVFSIIIPKKEEQPFTVLAKKNGLFPQRICHVQGTPTSEVKRTLIAFSFQKNKKIEPETLIIETSRHVYTKNYKQLVQDFYLKM